MNVSFSTLLGDALSVKSPLKFVSVRKKSKMFSRFRVALENNKACTAESYNKNFL